MLRASTRSSPGSSVVRSSGSSSLSGLATASAWRRASPAGSSSRSKSAAETNGELSTSVNPVAASARPVVRRSRCGPVSPRPAVARGCATGMFS